MEFFVVYSEVVFLNTSPALDFWVEKNFENFFSIFGLGINQIKRLRTLTEIKLLMKTITKRGYTSIDFSIYRFFFIEIFDKIDKISACLTKMANF